MKYNQDSSNVVNKNKRGKYNTKKIEVKSLEKVLLPCKFAHSESLKTQIKKQSVVYGVRKKEKKKIRITTA